MNKTLEVKKGEKCNKLLLLKELSDGIENLFEEVPDPDACETTKFFGGGNKIVAKKSFKVTLTIEEHEG